MKHVVFCVQNLSVPEDTRVWREAVAIQKAGYRVSAVCPNSSKRSKRETLEGIDIHRYPPAPDLPGLAGQIVETAWSLAFCFLKLLALRARGRVDVIHGANPPDTFFLLARVLRPFG